MVDVETTFGVPDEIAVELKKAYKDEKKYNLRVTRANAPFPPYYSYGDPRAKPDKFKFQGKEYWVFKVSKA